MANREALSILMANKEFSNSNKYFLEGLIFGKGLIHFSPLPFIPRGFSLIKILAPPVFIGAISRWTPSKNYFSPHPIHEGTGND